MSHKGRHGNIHRFAKKMDLPRLNKNELFGDEGTASRVLDKLEEERKAKSERQKQKPAVTLRRFSWEDRDR